MNFESLDVALHLKKIESERGELFKADGLLHGKLIHNNAVFVDSETGREYVHASVSFPDVDDYFIGLENYADLYLAIAAVNRSYLKFIGAKRIRKSIKEDFPISLEGKNADEIYDELATNGMYILPILDFDSYSSEDFLSILKKVNLNSLYDLSDEALIIFTHLIIGEDLINNFLVRGEWLDLQSVPKEDIISFLNKNGIDKLADMSESYLKSLFFIKYQVDVNSVFKAAYEVYDNSVFFYLEGEEGRSLVNMNVDEYELTFDTQIDHVSVSDNNNYLESLLYSNPDTLEEYYSLLDSIANEKPVSESSDNKDIKKINEIIDEVKKDVLFQDEAVKQAVVAVYSNIFFDNPKLKKNIFLFGPSGCGKTSLVESISRQFNLPYSKVDISDFSEAGYVGNSINDIFLRLINNCNGDVEKAERSILFLDEIDKKAGGQSESVNKKGVLNSLLSVLESGVVDVNVGPYGKTVAFDTRHLVIFLAGAFSDLYNDKSHVIKGFSDQESNNDNQLLSDEDLIIKAGVPAEFVGRTRPVVQMKKLSTDQYIYILKHGRQSLINQYISEFKSRGVEFVVPDKLYENLASKMTSNLFGARKMNQILDKVLCDVLLNYFENVENVDRIELGEDIIDNNSSYKLVFKKGE